MAHGGFFNNFMQGASTRMDQYNKVRDAEKLEQFKTDDNIREKIASVDPMTELYRRQKDIDLATSIAEKKAVTDQGMDQFNAIMGNGKPAPVDASSSNGANPLATPTPTITTPGVTGGMMAPTANPTAPSDMSVDDRYNAITRATTGKAIADLTGNKGAAAAFDTQIKLHTSELDRSKRIKEDNKDTLTAADGVNVPDDISKDIAKSTTAGHKSVYQTGKLERAMDPDTAATEQSLAADVHIPLAASYMTANPDNKEVSSVIKSKTLKAAQDIAIIKSDDPSLTPEDKTKAIKSFQKYMTETYKHYTPEKIAKDTNLHHVVNEELIARMNASVQPETPAEPVAITRSSGGTQEGATATNPKTGEKMIYDGGQWTPITAEATR